MPFIKINEAARRLGVSRGTVYNMIRGDDPPFTVTRVGVQLMIDEASFTAWLSAKSAGSPAVSDTTDLGPLTLYVLMVQPMGQLMSLVDELRSHLSEAPASFSFLPLARLAEAGDRSQPLGLREKQEIIMQIAKMIRSEVPTVDSELERLGIAA